MSVSTICHILQYDDNKEFQKAYTIKPVKFRMDDGIYNSILNWEIIVDEKRTKEVCDEYKRTEEEVKKLLFKNYWCEDILEIINQGQDNEDSVNNFAKVEKINLLKKREIQELLERIYITSTQEIRVSGKITIDKWDYSFLRNLAMIIGVLCTLDENGYVQIIFYQY